MKASTQTSWRTWRLGELLKYEQPGRYLVRSTEYSEKGKYPVLTAGKTFVLGYTNEPNGAYTNHPVIIFDDFTTASKYVDFDFKAKSSAMKMLTARAGVADLRFVYERMQLIKYPIFDHKRCWIAEFSKLEIEAPELVEQTAIAEVAHDLADHIATLERLIAKKHAIKQGMMQQLLTGRTRLPGSYSAWKETTLGSVSSVTMGQSPAGSTYNSDARGLPLVQGNADIRGRVTFDRIWTSAPTKTCEPGDVLLTVRAPVGYTAIASKRSCLGRGVCAISAGNDNRFMFHALVYAEPAWALYEQGSTFTAVNSNEVRSFAIQWPTDSGERQAIARVLDDADKELASLQARLAKARAIKTGMMQQLLTGRTRLPVEAAS